MTGNVASSHCRQSRTKLYSALENTWSIEFVIIYTQKGGFSEIFAIFVTNNILFVLAKITEL